VEEADEHRLARAGFEVDEATVEVREPEWRRRLA
jgi:hypothetical protein